MRSNSTLGSPASVSPPPPAAIDTPAKLHGPGGGYLMSWWQYLGSRGVCSSGFCSGSCVSSCCCPVPDCVRSLAPCPLLPCQACRLNTQSRANTLGGALPCPACPMETLSSWIRVPPLSAKTRAAEFSNIHASWALSASQCPLPCGAVQVDLDQSKQDDAP